MAPPREKPPNDSGLRSAAMLLAIPSLLIISPLVGFFLGDWGDKRFHTSPWLAPAGAPLGVAAGGAGGWGVYKKDLESPEGRGPGPTGGRGGPGGGWGPDFPCGCGR